MTSFALPGAIDVFERETGLARGSAQAILGRVQMRLNDTFGGQIWNDMTEGDVLSLLEADVPAPPTHKWTAVLHGSVVYVNLVPRNGVPKGYSFAARVTIDTDGGNHPLKGDLWKHDACGCLIFPGDRVAHDLFHASLSSPQKG